MRILLAVLVVMGGVVGLQSPAHAADKDCADFGSQKAAQLFFLNNNPAADPHRLDADGDGVVCESLGGPYYYGSDPTPGGTGGGGSSTPAPPPAPAPIKVVKVLKGDLIKVRQGSKRPVAVRLLGATVPADDACFAGGAVQDLRAWIKPGRVVRLVADKKAPRRDKQGHPMFNMVTVKGDYTIGGTQVSQGWAQVGDYRFADKKRLKRWDEQAEFERLGHYGECVADFGTEAHPYAVNTSFDFGPWRYQFGVTDGDALPEMQAENAAVRGSVTYVSPPGPGWVYVRVPVTVTRIGAGSGVLSAAEFELRRGSKTYDQFGASVDDWCGTGPTYIKDQSLAQGQTFTGFVCATIPAPLQSTDVWEIWSDNYDANRLISVG